MLLNRDDPPTAEHPLGGTAEKVRRDREAYADAGIDYLVVSPPRGTSVDALDAAIAAAAEALLG